MRRFIEVGYVARAHGVRGELRVETHDPESTALERAESLRIGGVAYEVAELRRVHGAYLLRLAEIGDRDGAEALRGQAVKVEREALELADGEYLLADLVGCTVLTTAGETLGQVTAIEVGPQSRLVVRDQREERLIPVVGEFLVSVDLEAGRILVDLPEGLPSTPIGK